MTLLRIAGAALLTLGGVALGWRERLASARRARLLAGLCAELGIVGSEILSLQSPLPELFSRLAETGPEPLRGFFSTAAAGAREGRLPEAWREGAESLPLGAEAAETLSRLGLSLGRYDAGRQAGELELCRTALLGLLEDERAARDGRCRLYPGLGACLGAMAALILL